HAARDRHPAPALGRVDRARHLAAAQPRSADRPRLLVPGHRSERSLTRRAPGADHALCRPRRHGPHDLAKVGAFTPLRTPAMSAIAGALAQRLVSLSLPLAAVLPGGRA